MWHVCGPVRAREAVRGMELFHDTAHAIAGRDDGSMTPRDEKAQFVRRELQEWRRDERCKATLFASGRIRGPSTVVLSTPVCTPGKRDY